MALLPPWPFLVNGLSYLTSPRSITRHWGWICGLPRCPQANIVDHPSPVSKTDSQKYHTPTCSPGTAGFQGRSYPHRSSGHVEPNTMVNGPSPALIEPSLYTKRVVRSRVQPLSLELEALRDTVQPEILDAWAADSLDLTRTRCLFQRETHHC
jgi:hypothetical protein